MAIPPAINLPADNPEEPLSGSGNTACIDDADLMRQIAEGNDSAMVHLINRWKRPLLNFFYRSTNDTGDSEDLAQMTFIRLHRAAPRYRPDYPFPTYLFQIARNLLINRFHHRRRKPAITTAPHELPSFADPSPTLAIAEIEEAFQHILTTLPEKHRTAILLYKQQDLSYAEIATSMGVGENVVKSWIHRARQVLREKLKDLL